MFYLAIFAPTTSAFAEDYLEDEMEQITNEINTKKRILMCIAGTKYVLARYQSAIDLAFKGEPRIKFDGLGETFRVIIQKRREFWNSYEQFKNVVNSFNPGTVEDFSKDLKAIHEQTNAMLTYIKDLQTDERRMRKYLQAIKMALASKNISLTHSVKELTWNDCDALNLEAPGVAAVANIRSVIAVIDGMQNYLNIVDVSSNIFALVEKLNLWATKQYEAKVTQRFDTQGAGILAKINQLEALEAILAKKVFFENDLAINGADNGIYNRFLQFESSLLVIEQKIKSGEAIRQAIQRFSGVIDVSQFMQDMQVAINMLRNEKIKIQDRGYRGTIQRQSLLNRKRLEKAAPEARGCRAALESHLKASENLENTLSFLRIDHLYLDSIKACSK